MKTPFFALALLPFLAPTAQAVEFGALRALQSGPIGDSPQFADISQYEAEGAVDVTRTYGSYTLNDDADTKVEQSAIRSTIAAGGGWSPTKNFELTGYIRATLASDYDEINDRTTPNTKLDAGLYKHELALFGLYRMHPIVFGGGLGVMLYGSESRELGYAAKTYKEDATSAAMPTLRLFGGVITKPFDGTIGLRVFSKGTATVKAKGPSGSNEFDLTRRNPAEIHADARLKFAQAKLGASLSYLLTGQASEQTDEWSMKYGTTGKKLRESGYARRNEDSFRIGVGGRFDPIKMVGILGGLTYTTSSYAKEEYASLEAENLGGLRFDLGTEVSYQMFRGFLQAGYQLDSTASFTQSDDSRSAANVERNVRSPIEKGDKVKMTQGSWNVVAGGGVQL